MKRGIVTLLVLLSFGLVSGQTIWQKVNNRYDMADYDSLRKILTTATITTERDSTLWLNWMGEYYYWLSYEDIANADTAKWMFERGINLGKQSGVKDVPYGYFYLHLGELSYVAKKYEEAVSYLEKALKERPFDSRFADKSPVYKGLGMTCAMMEDYDKALTYLGKCKSGTKGAYSETRMKGKVYALKGDTAQSLGCYKEFFGNISEEVRVMFDSLAGDDVKRDRESWWMSVRPFITDCWRLEGAAPGLLYDVALLTKGILLQQNSALGIRHGDVLGALDKGSVAIEWMTYENHGEKQLGAVVMRADGTVRFVHTCSVEEMNVWAEDGYSIFDNRKCIEAIWSPAMMKAIGKARKVYFAPDGILSQLGIEYMYPKAKVRLYRLTSTRELLRPRRHDYTNAAIFGDVDYDLAHADTSMVQIYNDDEAYRHINKRGAKFKHLPASKEECDSVAKLRHNVRDTLVMGTAATERNFRNIGGGYNMLFISTHGYCRVDKRVESGDFPRREKVDHSLSESGLVFCGYNAEQKERSSSLTDGIVSARELFDMDMSSVDLCVVSACEGALGQASTDGTYGIQRGLKAAGVGSMILSTWEVDDRATTFFMTFLYEALARGKTLHDAFWEARERLYNHQYVAKPADSNIPGSKPVMRGFHTDKHRNAFILIDEI